MVLGPVDMWTPVTVGPPPVWQPANTRLLGGMHACVQVVLPDVKVAADDVVVFLDKQYACADAAEAEQRGAVAALQVGRWQARGGGGEERMLGAQPCNSCIALPPPCPTPILPCPATLPPHTPHLAHPRSARSVNTGPVLTLGQPGQ